MATPSCTFTSWRLPWKSKRAICCFCLSCWTTSYRFDSGELRENAASESDVSARHFISCFISTPLRFSAGLFLEIFGNSFVQSRTSRRIADMAIALEKLLCDGDGYLKDLVDFGNLKFKVRRSFISSVVKRSRTAKEAQRSQRAYHRIAM
eukprot:scaffold434_cov186-Pinguiococcus_pyrenoidosus.AAC.63